MKERTKEEKIAIRIYSGELLLFAIIFAVIASLRITRVIGYNETRRIIFNYITLVGAAWGIADFVWALRSPKRRQRVSMIDKIVVLPLVGFMITYDLICLIAKPSNENFYIISVGCVIYYAAAIMLFEAIYHYFYPIQALIDEAVEDSKKPEEKSENKPE